MYNIIEAITMTCDGIISKYDHRDLVSIRFVDDLFNFCKSKYNTLNVDSTNKEGVIFHVICDDKKKTKIEIGKIFPNVSLDPNGLDAFHKNIKDVIKKNELRFLENKNQLKNPNTMLSLKNLAIIEANKSIPYFEAIEKLPLPNFLKNDVENLYNLALYKDSKCSTEHERKPSKNFISFFIKCFRSPVDSDRSY